MKVHIVGGGPAGLYFAILDEEGVAADADHGLRAQPAGRHLRLRRGVLRPDARDLPGIRPRELSADHRELRLLGRHRDPFQRHRAPHRRQRLLRLLARDAAAAAAASARASLGVELKFQTEYRSDSRASATPISSSRPTASIRALREKHKRPFQAARRPAPQQVRLDGLDAAARCLHVLLQARPNTASSSLTAISTSPAARPG